MILTVEEAFELLEKGAKDNPGRWVEHSQKVGEAAARIAKKMGLDSEKARAMGLIHDIGKSFGIHVHHVIRGYEYLKSLGYDEEYANICLSHSYLNHDILCTAGGIPDPESEGYEFRKKFIINHEYTEYDKIINLCDLLCTDKFVTLEKRLVDIMIRRGVGNNTVYHIMEAKKLKYEIDEKLGCNVYALFPEIGEELVKLKHHHIENTKTYLPKNKNK